MLQRNTKVTFHLIILFILLNNQLLAQNDESVTYTSEEVADINKYDYFNIDQFTQKTLFKVNLANSRIFGNNTGWIRDATIEQKLKPWLSIDVTGNYIGYDDGTHDSWIGGGFRFYPSKQKNSKATKDRLNNFTGNYFRLGYIKDFSKNFNLYSNDRIAFNVGRQKKISKFGYLDIAGEINWLLDERTLNLLARISAGIGYGPSHFNEATNKTKASRTEIWNPAILQMGSNGFILGPSQKFANISFSAEIHLGGYFTIKPTIHGAFSHFSSLLIRPEEEFKTIMYGGSASLEVRKYFGIKKRLERGRSVKAYSGTYAGIQFSNLYNILRTGGDLGRQNTDRFDLFSFLKIGWQERISKRIIFDINYGIGYNYNQINSSTNTTLGFLLVK